MAHPSHFAHRQHEDGRSGTLSANVFTYRFSCNTTRRAPEPGTVKLDRYDARTAQHLLIHRTCAQGQDISQWMQGVRDSTRNGTIPGVLRLLPASQSQGDSVTYAIDTSVTGQPRVYNINNTYFQVGVMQMHPSEPTGQSVRFTEGQTVRIGMTSIGDIPSAMSSMRLPQDPIAVYGNSRGSQQLFEEDQDLSHVYIEESIQNECAGHQDPERLLYICRVLAVRKLSRRQLQRCLQSLSGEWTRQEYPNAQIRAHWFSWLHAGDGKDSTKRALLRLDARAPQFGRGYVLCKYELNRAIGPRCAHFAHCHPFIVIFEQLTHAELGAEQLGSARDVLSAAQRLSDNVQRIYASQIHAGRRLLPIVGTELSNRILHYVF